MSPERKEFLNLRHFPAVLSREQTAWRLGLEVHEIDILTGARKLRPLAKSSPTAKKQFATVKIEQLACDEAWLDSARETIQRFWESKNASRRVAGKNPAPCESTRLSKHAGFNHDQRSAFAEKSTQETST